MQEILQFGEIFWLHCKADPLREQEAEPIRPFKATQAATAPTRAMESAPTSLRNTAPSAPVINSLEPIGGADWSDEIYFERRTSD